MTTYRFSFTTRHEGGHVKAWAECGDPDRVLDEWELELQRSGDHEWYANFQMSEMDWLTLRVRVTAAPGQAWELSLRSDQEERWRSYLDSDVLLLPRQWIVVSLRPPSCS